MTKMKVDAWDLVVPILAPGGETIAQTLCYAAKIDPLGFGLGKEQLLKPIAIAEYKSETFVHLPEMVMTIDALETMLTPLSGKRLFFLFVDILGNIRLAHYFEYEGGAADCREYDLFDPAIQEKDSCTYLILKG
jgi:hypothetical protein